jgi:hypothetical protein
VNANIGVPRRKTQAKHHAARPSVYFNDFLLGHTIFLGGFKFQLLKADEYTEKYMEDNPDIFPQASLNAVVAKIKKGGQAFKSLQDYVVSLIGKLDKDGNGVLNFKEFTDGLKG